MRKSNPPLDASASPVARIIHAIMLERNRHHVEVSLAAGLGSGYLRDLFRGKSKKPNYEDLVKIAEELGIDIGALSEQRAANANKEGGDESYTEEQMALLTMWGILSDEGQERAIAAIAKLILKYRRR